MSSATLAGIKPPRNAQVPGIAANSRLLLERVRAPFYSLDHTDNRQAYTPADLLLNNTYSEQAMLENACYRKMSRRDALKTLRAAGYRASRRSTTWKRQRG